MGYADGGDVEDGFSDNYGIRVIDPRNAPRPDPNAYRVVDPAGKPIPRPKPSQPPPQPQPSQPPVQQPVVSSKQVPAWQDPFARIGQKAAAAASGWSVPQALQEPVNLQNQELASFGQYLGSADEQALRGWKNLWAPSDTTAADPAWWDKKAQAASDVVRGVGTYAEVAGLPEIALDPPALAGGLATGYGLGYGTEAAAQKAGVPPGKAALAADVAGAIGEPTWKELKLLGYADGGSVSDDDRPDPSQFRVIDQSGKRIPLPKPIPQPTQPQPVWQDPFRRIGQKAAQLASGWHVPEPVNRAVDAYGNFLNRSADQMEQGWQDLWKPSDVPANTPGYWDKYAQAASNVVRGVGGLATPLLAPAAVAAPVATAAGIAGGIAGGAGTEAAARAAGVPQGEAALLGDVGGAWGGALGPHVIPQGLGAAYRAYNAAGDYFNRMLAYPTTGTENLWMRNPERGALWLPGMKLDEITPDMGEAIPRTGGKKGNTLTNEDLGRYFEQQVRSQMAAIPHDAADEAKLQRVIELGRPEIEDQLAKGPDESGINWYSEDTDLADRNLLRAFPELADSTKKTLQKSISAVMSNNQKPRFEANYGAQIYDGYRPEGGGNGRIPLMQPDGSTHWPAQGAYSQLVKIDEMIQKLGEKGYVDFITHPQTARLIKEFRPSIKAAEIRGAGASNWDDEVPGSLVLGPKIGRYFMDIMGMPQEGSTVDKWDVRGQQRRMGRMFGNTGELIEAPQPESDRALFMEQHRQLGDEYNLTRNQAQSALWHYEQDLYRRLGIRVDESSSRRSSGIADFLGLKGLEMQP